MCGTINNMVPYFLDGFCTAWYHTFVSPKFVRNNGGGGGGGSGGGGCRYHHSSFENLIGSICRMKSEHLVKQY